MQKVWISLLWFVAEKVLRAILDYMGKRTEPLDEHETVKALRVRDQAAMLADRVDRDGDGIPD